MTTKTSTFTLLLLAAAIALPARALTITLTPSGASASLTSAVSGQSGAQNGTLKAADVGAAFGGTWTSAGQRTSNGTSGSLTTNLTSGSWGSDPVSGTWSIAPSFWSTYSSAIISIHVGGGGNNNLVQGSGSGGDDDEHSSVTWFAWVITPSQTSGTWNYSNTNHGGGLSNMELWGSGQGNGNIPAPGVPDSGTTLALMGLALVGLALSSRTSARRR